MKRLILILFCLAFAKAEPQKKIFVDFKNAPENPLGIYYGCYECKGFKGKVYHTDFDWYDRDGNKIGDNRLPKEYEEGNTGDSYVKSMNGLVVEHAISKTDVSYYTYNNLNLITIEDNNYWRHEYEYDEENRVVRSTSFNKKDQSTQVVKRTYSTKNGILTINKTTSRNGEVMTSFIKFKDGLVMASNNSFGANSFTYQYDRRGNWKVQNTTDITGKVNSRKRHLVYWDEIDKIIAKKTVQWESKTITKGVGALFPYPKIEGVSVRNVFKNERTLDDGVLYYLDEGSLYYHGANAFPKDPFNKVKGTAIEISRDHEALFQQHGGKIVLYNRGNRVPFTTHNKIGTNYYLYHEGLQQHYTVSNYQNVDKFFKAQVYQGDQSFYHFNPENGNYRIFTNGKEIDYSTIDKLESLDNGDQVLIKNGQPYSVLEQSKNKKEVLGRVVPYDATQHVISKNLNVSNKFNKGFSLKAKKTGAASFLFYQDEQEIESPSYFITAVGDKDLILGYGLEDFAILNYQDLSIGNSTTVTQIAKENEIIIMYKNGKASYFYNNGSLINQEDYVLTTYGDSQWIVYLKKLDKTIFVDIHITPSLRFKSSLSYVENNWVYKTATGVVIYSNGISLQPDSFNFYVDGSGDGHVYVDEKPAYYIKDYKSKPVNSSNKLMVHAGQKYVKNKDAGSSKISQATTDFLEAQKGIYHSRQTKTMLKNLENSMNEKGWSYDQKKAAYTNLFNELYEIDKEASYQLMMKIDNQYTQKLLKSMPTDKRTFIRTRAKKELKSYEGAHSNVKQ